MAHSEKIQLRPLSASFTVCQTADASGIDLTQPYCFVGKTDEELSLVCETRFVPASTSAREDGWKAFRIEGTLDFSLVGILSRLSAALAANGIGIFAVSTYNTDYILVKEADFSRALDVLAGAGYGILPGYAENENAGQRD